MLDALTLWVVNLASGFPSGSLMQDSFGLGQSLLDALASRIAIPESSVPSGHLTQESYDLKGKGPKGPFP